MSTITVTDETNITLAKFTIADDMARALISLLMGHAQAQIQSPTASQQQSRRTVF